MEDNFDNNFDDKYIDLSVTNMPIKGIRIPKSLPEGGSMGFDPHKPRLVNIDPDYPSRACVVDLSKISKEVVEEAYKRAKSDKNLIGKQSEIASAVYRSLAVSNELLKPAKPIDSSGVVLSPSVSKRFSDDKDKVQSDMLKVTKQETQTDSVNVPSITVLFKFKDFGNFEANYHNVIINKHLLILVYDNNFRHGLKFTPPCSSKSFDVEIQYPDSCNKNLNLTVNFYGTKFKHNNYEYILLLEDLETVRTVPIDNDDNIFNFSSN